jgi:hypothetical protein
MEHRIFAVNVSRRLIATYRSETLTRYPFCVSTSQRDVIGYNQSMKPTAPDRNESGVFVTTSWRGFSLFR